MLDERRELESEFGLYEETYKLKSNDHALQLRSLKSEIRAASEDISEIKHKVEEWGKLKNGESSRCKVIKLKIT